MKMQLKRVVVTGIGTITPLGNNLNDYWNGLLNGVSGADAITLFDASKFKTRFACEVKGFDPTQFMDRKEARKLDRFAQLALVASDMAVSDAGISKENVDVDRVGVIFASGIGGLTTFQDEVIDFAKGDGTPRFNPFFIPKMILDIAAGQISMRHGFRGPNFAVVSACASSTNGMIAAADNIRLGKADIIISGGSEAVISMAGVGGFNAMKAMSERNDDPKTASRPYDKDRDGFVMGEAAGVVVLEEYEHAVKRGARIYCELVGYAATCDAFHITQPDPEGKGLSLAMKRALACGGVAPEEVDYINAHGTSTPYNDKFETLAIKKLFGDHARKLAVSSTKSMTGHLLGAAGGIESVISVKTIQTGMIAPTINLEEPDPDCDLDYVPNLARAAKVRTVLSNNLGFGGQNAAVVFRAL